MKHSMWISILASLVLGCSSSGDGGSDDDDDDDDDGSETTGDTSQNGVTPCGSLDGTPNSCIAGQYCDDEVLSICETGCLSNTNCADDQTCVKNEGEDVGSCQGAAGPGVTLEDFCTKVMACEPTATQAQCQQLFDGTNEACHACIVGANCTDPNACDVECGL